MAHNYLYKTLGKITFIPHPIVFKQALKANAVASSAKNFNGLYRVLAVEYAIQLLLEYHGSQVEKIKRSILFRFISQKMICFLVLILCARGISTELQARYTVAYQNIEDFEVEQKVDQLLLLMQKRLVIMHEVARTKWNQNLAIEDKIREQQSLAELSKKASECGLDEKWAAAFFQAQMDASKEMQKNDFTLWQKEGLLKFEQVLSLKDELRSYIDQINQEMLLLLSKIYKKDRSILTQPISNRKSDYIENDIWLLAIAPLAH